MEFGIQLYERTWVTVKEICKNNIVVDEIFWSLLQIDAAKFSTQEYAEEFIETNNLFNAKVVPLKW